MEETVTISKKEYDELVNSSMWMSALEAAGVDNWGGYSEACVIYDSFKLENEENE